MKDKNLPLDNNSQSLEDLTNEANNIIESLEKKKDLSNSIEVYQELLKLNNVIEKKFQKTTKNIKEETKKKKKQKNKKKKKEVTKKKEPKQKGSNIIKNNKIEEN